MSEPKAKPEKPNLALEQLNQRKKNLEAKLSRVHTFPEDRRDEIKDRTERHLADLKKLITKASK